MKKMALAHTHTHSQTIHTPSGRVSCDHVTVCVCPPPPPRGFRDKQLHNYIFGSELKEQHPSQRGSTAPPLSKTLTCFRPSVCTSVCTSVYCTPHLIYLPPLLLDGSVPCRRGAHSFRGLTLSALTAFFAAGFPLVQFPGSLLVLLQKRTENKQRGEGGGVGERGGVGFKR